MNFVKILSIQSFFVEKNFKRRERRCSHDENCEHLSQRDYEDNQ